MKNHTLLVLSLLCAPSTFILPSLTTCSGIQNHIPFTHHKPTPAQQKECANLLKAAMQKPALKTYKQQPTPEKKKAPAKNKHILCENIKPFSGQAIYEYHD